MKTPPFLLLATLLFWGWQSGFLLFGAIMGVVLESARLIKARWDLAEEDFRRIWNFCMLLVLALVVFSFAASEEGGGMNNLVHASALAATRSVGLSAAAFLRWLPMTFFLFVAAQAFSEREAIPLSAISFFARRRKGNVERHVNVSYPYFMVCLFSAGIHANQGTHAYFFGEAILIMWALWSLRSRRFGIVAWLGALAVVMGIAVAGHAGISQVRQMIGDYKPPWIERFMRSRTDASQSITSMGQIGRLKLSPKIVIRVQPKEGGAPPEYLREATYRNYRSHRQTWYVGDSPGEFADLTVEGDSSTWALLPGKTNTSIANIACYLDGWSPELKVPDGLLPLPTGCARLENVSSLVASIKKSPAGALLAAGPGVMIFDARFGPGATLDSRPASTNLDLDVPTNEIPALEQVISELNISGATDEQKLRAVQRFFADKFTYSTWQGPDKRARTNETVLGRFLLNSRSGHCEYFATAAVLLLRQLNIPARYAVGYLVHEPSGHGYVVRERDAHAWCLAWDEHAGNWIDFDTTPGSWVAEEQKRASSLEWLSDAQSWIGFQFAKFRWGQTNLRKYLFWTLVPVLAMLLQQIIFRRGRKRRSRPKTEKSADAIRWPGLDSEFYLLERKLAARGMPRQSGETLTAWLTRSLADPGLADLRAPLRELLRLHYGHRFDPRGLSVPERERLAREAAICLASIK